jgi:cobalt/nickel transport system permease protein
VNIGQAIHEMRHLDELALRESVIHSIHPLSKLLTTLVYLVVLASFDNTEISSLMPLWIFPIFIFAFSDTPMMPIVSRILFVLPLIIGIGVLQPFFDHRVMIIGSLELSMGWVVFLGLLIKSILILSTTLLLIATTGINKLAMALRIMKVPKLFVLQLLLTYRYISVLGEELYRMQRAYFLRATGQKGIHRGAWGSFLGQLLLRTFDRGHRIYQSMALKGFVGEYYSGTEIRLKMRDIFYFICWSSLFLIVRFYNIPMVLGTWVVGVFMQ